MQFSLLLRTRGWLAASDEVDATKDTHGSLVVGGLKKDGGNLRVHCVVGVIGDHLTGILHGC